MAKRGRPAKEKNPFDAVPEEFKEAVLKMDHNDIRLKISEVTLNQVAMNALEKEDGDLQEKKLQAKEAGAIYKEAKKANSQKILFAKQVLKDRGQKVYDASESELVKKAS
jgi:hypothetical protein